MEIACSQKSIVRLLQDYLLEHNLIASARALELESGCPVSEANDDLSFARDLVLDGRWAELEDFLAPLADSRGFDHAGVLFAVRRQRYLELLSGRLRGEGAAGAPGFGDSSLVGGLNATLLGGSMGPGSSGAPSGAASVLQVVAALRAVEAVCESKVAFNTLCYCLTLPSVSEHPEFATWSPYSGRQQAYLSVRRELLKVFPADAAAVAASGPPTGQLERLLCQAATAQLVSRVAADPRLIPVRLQQGRSLPIAPRTPTRSHSRTQTKHYACHNAPTLPPPPHTRTSFPIAAHPPARCL